MEDEPILIFAFKEAERGVPVTDEDVERGTLEQGWVIANKWPPIPFLGMTIVDPETRTICSLEVSWHLRRVTTTTNETIWVSCLESVYYQANKARLSEDEVFCMPMRVADLQPGMVFMVHQGRFNVCLPAQHARMVGDERPWLYPYDMTGIASVCCTRPSMQFILK